MHPASSPGSPTPSALLNSLFTQRVDAIIVTDPHFVITEFAGAAEHLFGWSAGEALGRDWCALMPSEVTGPSGDDVWRRLHAVAPALADARVRRKDGTWVQVRMLITPVPDGAGALAGWLGVVRESTPVAPSPDPGRAVLDSDAGSFDHALEGAGVGVFEADLQSRIAHRSPALIRMLGGDPATFSPALDVIETRMHPDDLVKRREDLALLQGAGRVRAEYRVRHEDGRWLWLEVRWTVTARDAEGRPTRVAGVVADITALKTAERKLREGDQLFRTVVEPASEAIHLSDPRRARDSTTPGDVLPVCMYCKRIRADASRWLASDQYLTEHTESIVSHGLCPSCADKFLADDDEGVPPSEG